jgi:hypothetical protein
LTSIEKEIWIIELQLKIQKLLHMFKKATGVESYNIITFSLILAYRKLLLAIVSDLNQSGKHIKHICRFDR